MTVAMETKMNEATSLAQTQELIMAIFSCVGYLRDLFPEESFQENKIAGMSLKRFKRGGDANSDELLNWIEEGCFDALSKKYLKSAILTVLADSSSPNNVLETYTLRVNYPDSLLHQTIDAATNNIAQLSLTRNDKSVLSVEASPTNFKESVSKILRSLCVMSQTLKNLPSKKCLSMKLSYYEEVTPMGYEPPGFVPAEFDIDHLFQGPTSKYFFGKAVTPYHNIGLSMETVSDDVRPSTKNETNNADSQMTGNTIDAQGGIDFNESIVIASQVAQPANTPPKFPQSQQQPAKDQQPTNVAPTIHVKVPLSELPETQQRLQTIKCICGVNEKNLEMLQCDNCTKWQHAVCAGYVSCRDRRLEAFNGYVCYFCCFTGQSETLKFVKNLSLIRKSLAIISAEGFDSLESFKIRLGVSMSRSREIRNRLTTEKFLLKSGKTNWILCKKDEHIKERIKFYFNQNLELHEEFVKAQEQDKSVKQGKRKGLDIEDEEGDDDARGKKDVPIEIGNTEPFEVADNVNDVDDKDIDDNEDNEDDSVFAESAHTTTPKKGNSTLTTSTPTPPIKSKTTITSPPSSIISKKKRKISVPSAKISCYLNNI